MNFLEAHRTVQNFSGGAPLRFVFAISGMPNTVEVFLKAWAAKRGYAAEIDVLPFNTLGQHLVIGDQSAGREVFVLFPWDLIPEADWRSGVPSSALDAVQLRERARRTLDLIAKRREARSFYVEAPLPPLFADPAAGAQLEAWLTSAVADAQVQRLPAEFFSMSSYLTNGSPFASSHIGALAQRVISSAIGDAPPTKKVLVTDLDNVLWRGVIGEDGVEGIQYRAEGPGFRHFIYQTLLAKLKREGVLLAAVSRNDEELANAPFRSGKMALRADDFVAIVASYNAKSAQIREIARHLNLGLDSFVFVDDNPIELEEVSRAIPEIQTVHFGESDERLSETLAEISTFFARQVVTAEDTERTEMYRRRLEGMAPVDADGADLSQFLRELRMSLTIHDRSSGDRARAVQLINKTNQFNLNGLRVTDEQVADVLASGGRLYTCTLSDRTGAHGEILSCLVDSDGTMQAFVMSCRVFQRRVEHAFLVWLAAQETPPSRMNYVLTARNEPMRQFLDERAFKERDGVVAIDLDAFVGEHRDDLTLFELDAPQGARSVAG